LPLPWLLPELPWVELDELVFEACFPEFA